MEVENLSLKLSIRALKDRSKAISRELNYLLQDIQVVVGLIELGSSGSRIFNRVNLRTGRDWLVYYKHLPMSSDQLWISFSNLRYQRLELLKEQKDIARRILSLRGGKWSC